MQKLIQRVSSEQDIYRSEVSVKQVKQVVQVLEVYKWKQKCASGSEQDVTEVNRVWAQVEQVKWTESRSYYRVLRSAQNGGEQGYLQSEQSVVQVNKWSRL
jgi:hypothetical protein